MNHTRKLSLPADNPEYFNVSQSDTDQRPRLVMGPDTVTYRRQTSDISDIFEPTDEVRESLENIEKLAEKQKSRASKNRLGSLKRLFSSGARRGSSSGVEENEYLPTPAGHHQSGSLPCTPTKLNNNNNIFRLSTDSTNSSQTVSQVSSSMTRTLPTPQPSKTTSMSTAALHKTSSVSYQNIPTIEPVIKSKPPANVTPVKSSLPPVPLSAKTSLKGQSRGSIRKR